MVEEKAGAEGDDDDDEGLNREPEPNKGSMTDDVVLVVVLKQFVIESLARDEFVDVGRDDIEEPL